MLALRIEFLTRRFHATPWDRQVNEGVVEWPPAPWRIFRAFLATYHLKNHNDINREDLNSALEKLAETLPSYRLPAATSAHTRHYMPVYKGSTSLIFDTFLDVDTSLPAYVWWPDAELSRAQHDAIAQVVQRIGYLGRAESWVALRLVDAEEIKDLKPNAFPLSQQDPTPAGMERTRVLRAMPAQKFQAWRTQQYQDLTTRKIGELTNLGKKPTLSTANKKEINGKLPETLIDALEASTGDLKKQGWSRPPASEWTDYARPQLLTRATSARIQSMNKNLPTTAYFSISSNVLPRLIDTISVTDRIRKGLLSHSDGAPVFSGRDADGNRLADHSHAYILCEANDSSGKITHVTIHAPMGFDATAIQAFHGLQKRGIWGHGGHNIQLVLLSLGRPEDVGGHDKRAAQSPLLASSTHWRSSTPFIPTRHPKRYKDGRPKLDENGLQIDSPQHELLRLLRVQGFPHPLKISPLNTVNLAGKETGWLEFRIDRQSGGGRRASNATGHGFEIVFQSPIQGPLALGYGAHFGLGLFKAISPL